MPSCPFPLSPHVKTRPVDVTSPACCDPNDTETTFSFCENPKLAVTSTGDFDDKLDPFANCPLALLPQVNTRPFEDKAIELKFAEEILTILSSF